MSEHAECPYCQTDVEINHDDGYGYEEDKCYQQECNYCHKNFIYYTNVSFNYNTFPAPCLNGGEHNFKHMYSLPGLRGKFKCLTCGEHKN